MSDDDDRYICRQRKTRDARWILVGDRAARDYAAYETVTAMILNSSCCCADRRNLATALPLICAVRAVVD